MQNKKLILSIAAGAAVLAGVAVIVARKKSQNKYKASVNEAKENFKSKLNELQRKAKKEYKNVASDAADAVNTAQVRANNWANKASKA